MASNRLSDPGFLAGKFTSHSFRDVLSGASSRPEFPDLKITSRKGLPSLWISYEEMLALAAPFEFALVEKFSGYYFRVFSHESYFISNCFMKLFKWTPYFDINIESPTIPIWVSFPNLRPHLFSPWILHGLGSLFGRHLRTDNATSNGTRPSVARVLVELDVTKRYHDQIWVLGHARIECHVVNPHLANPIPNLVGVGVVLNKNCDDNCDPVSKDEIHICVDNISPGIDSPLLELAVLLGMADGNDSVVPVAELCGAIKCGDDGEVGDHVLVSSPRGVIETVNPDIVGLVTDNELLNVGDKEFCDVNMGVVNIDSSNLDPYNIDYSNLDPYAASPVMTADRVVSVSSVGPVVNEQLVHVPVALISSNALNAHLGARSGETIGEQIDWLESSPSSPSEVGEK
ncbi:hypothetical protein M5K25_015532 [Dendrobium thyrsiflorum]|uniref:DUF4283 domain-containing protein n=1 Tax=Dendrobium thyrsiflorum TaxID=117978 RepID=A0ABD0UYH2_DENTH